jgi:hypothetical protein
MLAFLKEFLSLMLKHFEQAASKAKHPESKKPKYSNVKRATRI